jgi:glycosyltransferase involved in cell wall biosynthesis
VTKLRVLLVSPVATLDPPGGDVTWTESLLEQPPADVEYETYDEAMRRGTLHEHGRRVGLRERMERLGHPGREGLLLAAGKLMTAARRRNLLFWEPFRFFTVVPGEYDLIHMHVFSARFIAVPCPLVVSNGGELAHLYRHARHMPEAQIRRRERADRLLGRILRVNVNSEYLPDAARLMTYTEQAKLSFVRRGVFPADRIDVVPLFLKPAPAVPRPTSPRRVGFVARNFRDKGGPTLLEAWPKVRSERPDAELLIVGCEPEIPPAEAARQGIRWEPYVPRAELLETVLPSIDVFAYPTNYDYVPSFIVLEVMTRGIPIAVSDHSAMPEVFDQGAAGLISPQGDAAALAGNILRLLDSEENRRFGAAARAQFERRFSSETVMPLIRASYDRALALGPSGKVGPTQEG